MRSPAATAVRKTKKKQKMMVSGDPDVVKPTLSTEVSVPGDWRWCKHKMHAYQALRFDEKPVAGEPCSGTDIHGCTFEVRFEDIGDSVVDTTLLKNPIDDMVQMAEVNEASIVYTLRERFAKNKIYTSIADILVSVNPFKMLPLYTPEVIYAYAKAGQKILAPHVYTVAKNAYDKVSQERTPVSILISGESGAGKTEATKQCLGFLSEVAGSDTGVEQKVLSANPVSEIFWFPLLVVVCLFIDLLIYLPIYLS